jgi:hypothetical protein
MLSLKAVLEHKNHLILFHMEGLKNLRKSYCSSLKILCIHKPCNFIYLMCLNIFDLQPLP